METCIEGRTSMAKSGDEATPFPYSRAAPSATQGGFRDLGFTPLALQLGLTTEQTNGHWCSRCRGIWFGYILEVECPVCRYRNG